MKSIITFAILLIAANSRAALNFPGTDLRPILSATEAAGFTQASYLQGWFPQNITLPQTATFIVGPGNFATIQAAVNAAIKTNSPTRQYIQISQGRHQEVVIIPATTVPLTLYGTGLPSATIITHSISAQTTGNAYQELASSFFAQGDAAFNQFTQCVNRPQIGTACSGVVRVKADNVELINLTIENLSQTAGTNQAVALQIDADRVHVRNSRILGHQDTLYVGSTTITRILRIYFENCNIEGDSDFVFGSASAVFNGCVFRVKTDRTSDPGEIFAVSTPQSNVFGFLVIRSTITGDASVLTSRRASLARTWDVQGTQRNGQLVIRETQLDAIFNVTAPYEAATSGRPYVGNGNAVRDTNSPDFARFWEFNNNGFGA